MFHAFMLACLQVPDTFFANDKNSFLHDVTERNKLVRLAGDGSVTYGMRFTTTLACMMDLHYYPLDSQNCTVEIESCKFLLFEHFPVKVSQQKLKVTSISDGYTVSDVVMYWRNTPIRGVEEAELPQFTIMGYETNDRKVRCINHTLLDAYFTFHVLLLGKVSHRSLSKTIVVFQAAKEHRILHFPDVLAEHSYRDAVLGVVLDQS